MKFDTKIAVVVREDLLTWQKLNVTAFTVSGIAGTKDVMGEPYQDGSDLVYLPLIKQPIMVYTADRDQLRTVYQKAVKRKLDMTIYIDELFSTTHDAENREVVRAINSEDLNLSGLALYGSKSPVDKVLKGLPLHS